METVIAQALPDQRFGPGHYHGDRRLLDEDDIIWLEPLDRFDYVREVIYDSYPSRWRKPSWRCHDGRLVGFATLVKQPQYSGGPRCHRAGYSRRVFWVACHDRDSQPDGVYRWTTPCEAVDPRMVAPRVAGRMTERAWGTALPIPLKLGREGVAAHLCQPQDVWSVAVELASPTCLKCPGYDARVPATYVGALFVDEYSAKATCLRMRRRYPCWTFRLEPHSIR